MLLSILIVATALMAAAAGWSWRASFPRRSVEHLLLALLGGAALLLILLQAAHGIGAMLSDSWNFIRLAPSAALLQGAELYPSGSEGAILGWIYGPVLPLLNLPAVLLPDPVSALVAAGILNEALLLLPLFLVLRHVLPEDPAGCLRGLILLAAVHILMLHVSPSRYWLRNVHADTPAVALGLLSLWVLLQGDAAGPLSPRRLLCSALLAAAAVYSKQVEIGLLPASLLYVGLRDGRRQAARFTLFVAASGALGLLCSWACFGAAPFFLNLLTIPSLHPADGSVFLWGLDLLDQSAWPLLGFLLLALGELSRKPGAASSRDWVLRHPWCLPAAAAIFMLPTSLLGRAKLGAYDPAYHAVYYLLAALGMVAARRLSDVQAPFLRRLVPAAILGVTFAAGFVSVNEVEATFRDSRLARDYRFATEHPGEVWFLANPLVTLYTDRKLYHQGYGVYDRFLAGRPPSEAQLSTHRPTKLRWIATPGSPFWCPDGLSPIPAPEGLSHYQWLAPR